MESVRLIECINTWQGEGPDSGRRMLLCRFKYCNMKCRWCDTIVKMRAIQEAEFQLVELQDIIYEQKTGLMITGGEPTFSNQLEATIEMLNKLVYPVANVETNGLELEELIKFVHDDKPVKYIFSPKMFDKDQIGEAIMKGNKLSTNENVFIKVVCDDEEKIETFLANIPNTGRIYLMPQGRSREELITNAPMVFDLAEKFKVNFTSRVHLMYDFV